MESMDLQITLGLLSLLYTAIEIAGIITAVMAVRDTRTLRVPSPGRCH